MSDVFLYAVPVMIYCWNKCLNVRRGSTLSDLFTPCITQAHLPRGKPSDLSWPGPALSGWYHPSVPGAQWILHCNTFGTQCGAQRHCFGRQGHIGRWALLSENINSIEVPPSATTTSAKAMSNHIPSWRCLFLCERPAGNVMNFDFWTLIYNEDIAYFIYCKCSVCLILGKWFHLYDINLLVLDV